MRYFQHAATLQPGLAVALSAGMQACKQRRSLVMTNEQLKHLLRVLDADSVPALDEDKRVGSSEWRREGVHTESEITLGSLLGESAEHRPTD